jgi:hypothetical protein
MIKRGASGRYYVINPPPPPGFIRTESIRLMGFFQYYYWKVMTGATVFVEWKRHPIDKDPIAVYRPWLEENIGKQGRDWQWNYAYMGHTEFELAIVVSRRKKKFAPMMILMWN